MSTITNMLLMITAAVLATAAIIYIGRDNDPDWADWSEQRAHRIDSELRIALLHSRLK